MGPAIIMIYSILILLFSLSSPPVDETTTSSDHQIAFQHLAAGRFNSAMIAFKQLAEAETDRKAFYATAASILKKNRDGIYLLTESYPPGAKLLGDTEVLYDQGFILLSSPEAINAAICDTAKTQVRLASALLNKATRTIKTKPKLALDHIDRAESLMDDADRLHPGISDSFRFELLEATILSHRTLASHYASKFDTLCEKLSELKSKDYPAYCDRLEDMLGLLDKALDALNNIVQHAMTDKIHFKADLRKAADGMNTIKSLKRIITREQQRNG